VSEKIKYYISYAAWPGLFAICVAITAVGFSGPHPVLYFNAAYIFLIVSLFLLERFMPFETEWHKPDGQIAADLLHTLSSKGTVQLLVMFSGLIGLAALITPMAEPGYGIWPREWPLWIQVIMGVALAELPLYWAHRLGHEWSWMWRFHSVHHSVTKLWIVNTGRFHFMDSLIKIIVSMALLMALGAPMEVVKWLMAVTAFIGMLTHCNVEMRFGFLSWWFNTPELHRWHHSRKLKESNKNYCENVMIWDHVFGTYFREKHRRPPANIGISHFMPPRWRHQIVWPFLSEPRKARIEARYKAQQA
jgi:sterol desaturase/sphingolipid hydroxylase (fatty acid hydroxylase superfamily)